MAVTSIWPIKGRIDKVIRYAENPEKTTAEVKKSLAPLHAIDGVIQYAANDMKTEKRLYVTGINCRTDIAAQQFMETKQFWNKTDGRTCFHGYQSFKPGEVTAEEAHNIGVETARRLWGEDFEVVVATHINTGTMHNHIVLNSVSITDGHHFHNGPEDYKAFREMSDQICREHELSVIENPGGHGKNYGEYLAEKNGKPTVRSAIRADIDRAIEASLTENEFIRMMKTTGYEMRLYGSYGQEIKSIGLKPPGGKHFFRFSSLGDGYSYDAIIDRIFEKNRRREPFPEEKQEEYRHYREETKPKEKATGLYALYLYYCYELHIIVKYPASVKQVSLFLREELTKLDELDKQVSFLGKNSIETMDELLDVLSGKEAKVGELKELRKDLRNELKRVERLGDHDQIENVKQKIRSASAEIKTLSDEVKICKQIKARTEKRAEEFTNMPSGKEFTGGEGKEKANDELFGRRGRAGREDDIRGN